MSKLLVSGIFRVCDTERKTSRVFIGFSYNVEGTMKRLRFELALNACSYKPLQAFYNECLVPKVELLEQLVANDSVNYSDPNDLVAFAHIQAKLLLWSEKLAEGGDSVELIQQPVV